MPKVFKEHCPIYQVVLWFSFFSLLPAWEHGEGVTLIESSLGTRQGDPLGGPLFALTHYQTLLETIA
jgi:hypothetical protein